MAAFLSALFCSALAAPSLLEGAAPSKPSPYSYPAPSVGLAVGAAAAGGGAAASGEAAAGGAAASGGTAKAGGAKAATVVRIVKDDRVVDESGSYSFDVAGEDNSARQESGAPLAEGGILQTGSYTYTQPDGTVFELKYVADANGFQPESSALPALPDFVKEQIEFAKNNPKPEGGEKAAGAGAAVGGAAVAAARSGYIPRAGDKRSKSSETPERKYV